MVEYSRSHIRRVNSSFVIEPFHQKKVVLKENKTRLMDAMNVGVYLVVPLLVGLGIGIILDKKLGTKPICIISGLLVGSVGSFFNLIKIVREFSNNA